MYHDKVSCAQHSFYSFDSHMSFNSKNKENFTEQCNQKCLDDPSCQSLSVWYRYKWVCKLFEAQKCTHINHYDSKKGAPPMSQLWEKVATSPAPAPTQTSTKTSQRSDDTATQMAEASQLARDIEILKMKLQRAALAKRLSEYGVLIIL